MSSVAVRRVPEGDDDVVSDSERECMDWRHDVRGLAIAHRTPAPRYPPRVRRRAALIVIALHLVIVAALRWVLRVPQSPMDTAIVHVELLTAPAPEPALPQPLQDPRLPAASGSPRTARVPALVVPSPGASVDRPSGAAPDDSAPQVNLYNPDGTAMLPPPPDGFHVPRNRAQYAWENIMRRNHNPLHCRRGDHDLGAFENVGDVIARNPILSLFGLGDPQRAVRTALREAEAALVCDDP